MTITTLKIIALILMTIDHIGSMLFPDVMWLGYIGRLSAPIFIFCITEAMRHTHDQKKYLIKLFGFSLITTFLFYAAMMVNFCMMGEMHRIGLNVTGLLFQGALLIYIIEAVRQKKDKWQILLVIYVIYQLMMKLLYTPILQHDFGYEVWLVGPLSSIYSGGGILWIALFLVFYYSKQRMAINYIIYCVLFWFVRVSMIFAKIGVRLEFYGSKYGLKIISDIYQFIFRGILGLNTRFPISYGSDYQWLMVFSVIFIMLYNGQYGKGMKKLFYVYYPLHIIVLYFVEQIFI